MRPSDATCVWLPTRQNRPFCPSDPSRDGPANAFSCREIIPKELEAGLSAQLNSGDLVIEHRFTASYDSVKRFVPSLEHKTEIPFRRMECAPGYELQVDVR